MPDAAPAALPVDDQSAALLAKSLQLETFFPEFKAEQVRGVFPHSRLEAYARGVNVITQGETGRDLFVIYIGKVSIIRPFAGGAVATLGAGDLFGEIGLVRDGVRTATAVTVEEAKIFRLAYQDLQYLLSNDPKLAEHLNKIAFQRL